MQRRRAAVRASALLLALAMVSFAQRADEPMRARLVGTWKLTSASATGEDGRVNQQPFGAAPTGLLIYSPDGTMSAMISYGGRKSLTADRTAAPAAERAEAFATFFGYAGRYSVEGEKVVHHVEVASVQNWVNTDLVRVFRFENERLVLQTPPIAVGGSLRTTELIWERVSP